MKKFLLAVCLVVPSFASAAPQISGNPVDIEKYLTDIPKVISLSASAEKVLVSSEAKMTLSVNTEAKKLSDALQSNFDIRASLRSKLGEIGIEAENISESKFSSTPSFGMFSDEPKSYAVNNTVSVQVVSEKQMIAVASLADNSDSIRYLSTKPTLLEKGKVQAELVATAMQTIKEKAAMYQQELDAILVPVEVTELAQNFIAANPNYSAMRKSLSSSGDRGVFDSKELSVEVTVKYQLRPNK